jgi:hypothetical protein|tara:strand:+ start:1117 stop:1482 length:366 start_codon:yes stop_codon:yes gene_type:complete
MNLFTIYEISNGEILYNTSTVAEGDQLGLQSGEGFIEGHYQSNEYVITSGNAVKRTDNVLQILRDARDSLLQQSDWTQSADSPLTDSKKTEWQTYRQALRDLPTTNTETYIEDVVYPTPPA